jgi:hypothetical protein
MFASYSLVLEPNELRILVRINSCEEKPHSSSFGKFLTIMEEEKVFAMVGISLGFYPIG